MACVSYRALLHWLCISDGMACTGFCKANYTHLRVHSRGVKASATNREINMKRTLVASGFLLLCMALPISGCMPGTGGANVTHPAGFFMGIWHGWIAPVSLVGGLFDPAIRVYESSNTGWWYDFGFYIAIVGGFGGLSLVRKNKTKNTA